MGKFERMIQALERIADGIWEVQKILSQIREDQKATIEWTLKESQLQPDRIQGVLDIIKNGFMKSKSIEGQ